MSSNKPFILPLVFAFFSFTAAAQEGALEHHTSLHGLVDITQYSNTNVSGGVGFEAGVTQYLYFHKFVGAFVGVDYAMRAMKLNESQKIGHLEIPFGPSFHNIATLPEGISGNFDFGLACDKLLTETHKDAAIGKLKGGLGLYFAGTSLFAINPNFDLGIKMSGKLGFSSPFAELDGPLPLAIGIGLVANVKY